MKINLKDYLEQPEEYTASVNAQMTIDTVKIRSAEEVYGDGAIEPTKEVVCMHGENDVWVYINMPKGLEYDEEEEEFSIVDIAAYQRAITNVQSRWAKFISKYGIPTVGTQVDLTLNEALFYEVIL